MSIQGFHAHVYFDDATRDAAERIYAALGRTFDVELGRIHPRAVGPHATGMFQVTVPPDQFGKVVPWLMVNRDGLSVLVHPNTDDPVADHQKSAIWMGPPRPIDVEILRRLVARRFEESRPETAQPE